MRGEMGCSEKRRSDNETERRSGQKINQEEAYIVELMNELDSYYEEDLMPPEICSGFEEKVLSHNGVLAEIMSLTDKMALFRTSPI